MIELSGLTRTFPTGGGVRDVSFRIETGEHVTLAGPSGAGKTTLLRLIAGLERADSGTVRFGGRDVTLARPHERHVSFISQWPALYPHLNVLRNLTIGVELRNGWRRPDAALIARAEDAADKLAIYKLLSRSVHDLSGGEQQRVALGRAIVSGHPVWLWDEPFAHLDPLTRQELREQLHLIRAGQGPTIVEVTHDPGDACSGQRVIVLTCGSVAQIGPPAEVSARPNSRGVATSLGWPPMNIIDGPAAPAAGAPGLPCAWGILPHEIGLGPAPVGAMDLGEWELSRVEDPGPRPLWSLVRAGCRLYRWAESDDTAVPRVRLHALRWTRFDARTGQRIPDGPEG